jgi:uncharacterized damage-inducible protein DinB
MDVNARLRAQVSAALGWEDAHAGFESAVADVPPDFRGRRPAGSPHSLWELVEHLRLTQYDILDFCRNTAYVEQTWPDDYWPRTPEPPSDDAWRDGVAGVRRDREALQEFVERDDVDLFARIPHGTGQTYLREALLVIDHSAYHVGQIVLTRRLLGIWSAS